MKKSSLILGDNNLNVDIFISNVVVVLVTFLIKSCPSQAVGSSQPLPNQVVVLNKGKLKTEPFVLQFSLLNLSSINQIVTF